MLRKIGRLVLVASLALAALPGLAVAQDSPDGYTTYQLNMRAGPGTNHPVITILDGGTGLYFEARTADLTWLLARTADGAFRGWLAALYVGYNAGFGSASHLPVSDEIIAVQPPAPAPDAAPATNPGAGSGAPGPAISALAGIPVVSGIGPRASEIFQRGQALGNQRNVFTIVGGCNSLARAFMQPFGSANYRLGPYAYLQPTIDFFGAAPVDGMPNSFIHKGVAVRAGYTAMSLTDPSWADPQYCQGGETPLACEYRRSKPAVALVLLGVLDVYWFTPEQFDANLRRILDVSIEQGVIPVLTTFPITAGSPTDAATDYGGAISFDERAQYRARFNEVIVNLAHEYGVPLLNLWSAAQGLPRAGYREADFIHFWEPDNASLWANLNGGQNQCVFAMWNLVALQMLDGLRTGVLGG